MENIQSEQQTIEELQGESMQDGSTLPNQGHAAAPTEDGDDETGDTPPSIRDAVESAVEASEASAEEDDDGKPRDDKGRFAKKEQNAQAADATEEGAAAPAPNDGDQQQATGQGDNAASQQPAQQLDGAQLLARFSPDDKAVFDKIPDELKEPVLNWYGRMQGDYTRKMQELAPLRNAFQPYDNYLQQIGITQDQAVAAMMPIETQLRMGNPDQKMQALRKLALDYGVIQQGQQLDLGQGQQQFQQQDPYANLFDDPNQQQNQQQNVLQNDPAMLAVMDRLNGIESTFQQQAQTTQQQQVNTQVSAIDNFIKEKNSDETLKHPYANEVLQSMTTLAQVKQASGQSVNLQDLYDEAIWSNPSTREKLLATQQSQNSDTTRKQKEQKARQAKKSGSSVSGSPQANGSTKGTKKKNASIRDTIEAAMDEEPLEL